MGLRQHPVPDSPLIGIVNAAATAHGQKKGGNDMGRLLLHC
jgi:hypothetical protein